MILRGSFNGWMPCVHLAVGSTDFQGNVEFLIDTGAQWTVIFDRDARRLGIRTDTLEVAEKPIVSAVNTKRGRSNWSEHHRLRKRGTSQWNITKSHDVRF